MEPSKRRSRLNDIQPIKFETKAKSKKKWILFCSVVILVIVLAVTGLLLYKHFCPDILPANATYNAHVLHTNTFNSNQKDTVYAPYKNGIVYATRDRITFSNTKGETVWQLNLSVLNPILKVNENYILLAGKNTQNVYLIKDGKVILQSSSTYGILNAGVAKNGTFFLVEDEPHYKGKLTVRNAKNEDLFVWHAGASYIIDAAFNDRASQIALTTLTTASPASETNNSYDAALLLFKLHEGAPYATQEYPGQLAANVFYTQRAYIVVTNSAVSAYSDTDGAQIWTYSFAPQTLQHLDFHNNRLAFVTADENNTQTLHVLKANGTLMCPPITNLTNVGYLSLSNDIVATGSANNASVYKLDGTLQYRIAMPKSYTDICLYNNGQYILGTNNIVADILVTK